MNFHSFQSLGEKLIQQVVQKWKKTHKPTQISLWHSSLQMTLNNLTKKGQFSDVTSSFQGNLHLGCCFGQDTNEYMHTIHQLIDLGLSQVTDDDTSWVSPVSQFPKKQKTKKLVVSLLFPTVTTKQQYYKGYEIQIFEDLKMRIHILGMPISRKPWMNDSAGTPHSMHFSLGPQWKVILDISGFIFPCRCRKHLNSE